MAFIRRNKRESALRTKVGVPILAAVLSFVAALFYVGVRRQQTTQGLYADQPMQVTARQWKQALIETKNALRDKNLSMIAAGMSYFSSLAFFPAVAAAVAIAAFAISPTQIESAVAGVESYMPRDMASLVTTQLETQVEAEQKTIFVAMLAILLSLVSVAGAVDKLIKGLSIAYDTEETRSFIQLKILSGAIALGGILFAFVVIGLLALNESFLSTLGVYGSLSLIVLALRWPLIILLLSIVLSFLYRYGPDRKRAKWQWVSWGALAATLLWLVATIGFFVYVQNFSNFSASYSIFAGIIVLMTWLYISAFIVLLGAQVNHRLETKTVQPKVFE